MRPGAALGLSCLAPAPVSRAQTYNRAALLRGFGIETYSQELCPGSSRKRCWAVSAHAHDVLERQSKPRWLMLHCSYRPSATGFVPGLTAFRSFRQRLSDKRSGICCPRASFSARHTGGNVELSSPAPETHALSMGQCVAWGFQFPAGSCAAALPVHNKATGKKTQSAVATITASLLQPTLPDGLQQKTKCRLASPYDIDADHSP